MGESQNNTPNDNKEPGINLGEELGKVFKMGVGAVAGAVGKGVTFVQDLTTEGTDMNKRAAELGEQLQRKGSETLDKTRVLGEQLKSKVNDALDNLPGGLQNLMNNLEKMTSEQLQALRDKIDEILNPAESAEDQPAAPAEDEPAAPSDGDNA